MDVSRNSDSHFPTDSSPLRASCGFTLIEVLVTLFILSVGLLGLAALQIQGLRATHEATLLTQAVACAVDMAERVRAHSADTTASLTVPEIQDWKARLAQRLPDGDGSIDLTTASASIDVRWDERGTSRQFTLKFTP